MTSDLTTLMSNNNNNTTIIIDDDNNNSNIVNNSDKSNTTTIAPAEQKQQQTKTSYPCNYKKERGMLILQDDKISFVVQIIQQNTKETKMKLVVDIKWLNIKNHQVSPLTYNKKLLKLNLLSLQQPIYNANNINNSNGSQTPKPLSSITFDFQQRIDLDRIRKDITNRLHTIRNNDTNNNPQQHNNNQPNKRIRTSSMSIQQKQSQSSSNHNETTTNNTNNFSKLDAQILAVTRSSILATDPTIRSQHKLLVLDSKSATLTEDDFWENHKVRLAQEAAKIHGRYRPGMGSMMRSNLDLQNETSNTKSNEKTKNSNRCKIRLGVEEMRQIFILYPAVHKAYEEKVPLELSEEQFWRRYLESEYFHRDRGRVGMGIRNLTGQKKPSQINDSKKDNDKDKEQKLSQDHESTALPNENKKDTNNEKDDEKVKQQQQAADDEARGSGAIVKGSEDIFSRYDVEMKKQQNNNNNGIKKKFAQLRGNNLAIGQFDLTSTYNTERSKVSFLPATITSDYTKNTSDYNTSTNNTDKDNNNNANNIDDSYPSRVINKYNRHWAMVLNPDDATAGCDLMNSVARKSITHALPDDNIAKCNGNVDDDFYKLCSFASAHKLDADHVKCVGMDYYNDNNDDDDDHNIGMYTELLIHDKLAYSGESLIGSNNNNNIKNPNHMRSQKDTYERQAVFAKATLAKIRPYFKISLSSSNTNHEQQIIQSSLPPPTLGKELLFALTKKMAENDNYNNEYHKTYKIISALPDTFKKNLFAFFNRTSELLRHFFGLRSIVLNDDPNNKNNKELSNKLSKIVSTMEELYREMEIMRKDLPQTKDGEVMRKMCLPIMGQLDWAFKLNRDGATIGSATRSGGFVTVEEF